MAGQDKILTGLNPPQLEAVTYGDGPLLVLAGAGSGKTRVLTSRVAYLLAMARATPEQILAVTFTNKAAGEMKSRIERLTEINQLRMQVSTFHSFAGLLLRYYGERIGIPNNYTVYDEEDASSLVKRCTVELGFDIKTVPPRVSRDRISDAKSEMVGVEEFQKLASNFMTQRTARIYGRYQSKLRAAGALDFDDLLFYAVRLLQTDAEICDRLQRKYRFLLIDEYQDTNRAQYLLAKILSAGHQNIFAVGDEDQSIYGWRGANIQNILNFEVDFPSCKIIRLEQNYRSTQTILKAASIVVSNNQMRKGKTLYSVGDKGEALTLLITQSDRDEAERIADRIEEHIKASIPRSEIAILYRTNAQSRALEESLKRRFIPYKIVGGLRFYQRKEIKDLLAYMKLLENPNDDASFRRIINYPRRGIGDATVAQLSSLAVERGCSPFNLVSQTGLSDTLSSATISKVAKFVQLMAYLKEMSTSTPLEPFIKLIADKTGIRDDLKAEDPSEIEGRIENIDELASSAGEYASLNPDSSMTTFLQEISLYTDLDDYDRQSDAVTLMTLHAAKGLEFESVFVTGLEEGLFPISRSLDDQAKLEEERRLFYVGMTRAKSKLTLSYALTRVRFGERSSLRSRFIDEIPDDVINAERFTPYETQGRIDLSTASTEYADPDDPYAAIHVGSVVYHPRWGEGSVLTRSGYGDSTTIEVRFTYAGRKKLIARFAKLRVVR
jgi:DNA helicase-2/ATP-dependent DNA helicase PcrA